MMQSVVSGEVTRAPAVASPSAIRGSPIRSRRSRIKSALKRGVGEVEGLFVSDEFLHSESFKAVAMGCFIGFVVAFIGCCKGQHHDDCSAYGCFSGVGIVTAIVLSLSFRHCMRKAREQELLGKKAMAAQMETDEFDIAVHDDGFSDDGLAMAPLASRS